MAEVIEQRQTSYREDEWEGQRAEVEWKNAVAKRTGSVASDCRDAILLFSERRCVSRKCGGGWNGTVRAGIMIERNSTINEVSVYLKTGSNRGKGGISIATCRY